MSVSLSGVRSQVMSLANLSTTYGTKDSDLGNTSEIDEAILERDLEICRTILETPAHSHLTAFSASTASGVSSGTILLDHVGPVFNVKRTRTDTTVVEAQVQPYPNIIRWRRNDSGLYSTAGLKESVFAVVHNQIYFVGGGSISYQYRTLSKLASCQAPDEFTGLEVAGTLAWYYGKEAMSETLAQHYDAQFEKGLERIRQNLPPLPLEVMG